MKNHKTIGDYYAHLLEKHLNAAIQKKLDETSDFKKKIAGIRSIDDAKAKGYAPAPAQVEQIKDCVKRHANEHYHHPPFHHLPPKEAISGLVTVLKKEIGALNEQWRKEKCFTFDQAALEDLASEAAALILEEHHAVIGHFFK